VQRVGKSAAAELEKIRSEIHLKIKPIFSHFLIFHQKIKTHKNSSKLQSNHSNTFNQLPETQIHQKMEAPT
jgi:hypothetical protein